MNRKAYGFTLVELIIVIAVIGILAGISIVGFTKYTADARDSQRASKISVLAESLEKYYDKNGEYPSCSALTQSPATVSSTTLPGINPAVFTTPSAAKGTNSIYTTGPSICAALSASSSIDGFAYVGDGSTSCKTGPSCLQYTLQYRQESTGNIISLSSRRTGIASVNGAPHVSITSTTSSSVSTAWTTVTDATSYTVQSATDAGFTANTNQTTGLTGTSSVVTGLDQNTTYFFRVVAVSGAATGPWSNTVNASTNPVLTAPTNLTATTDSSSQVTVGWTAVANAASYTIEYSPSSSFSSPSTVSGITSTSQAISGLSQGRSYYFRVYAVAGANGPTSDSVSATTTIDTPSTPVISTTTSGATTTYTWTTPSCATDSVAQYQYQYVTDWYSPPTTSAWFGPTSVNSLTRNTSSEGYQYSLNVQAQCYNSATAVTSGWSGAAQASYIRPMTGPGAITFSISRPSASQAKVFATSSCASGRNLMTRSDMEIITGTTVWDTNVRGWYADSHGGSWAHNTMAYRGTTETITAGSAGKPPYADNSQWAMAVEMACQNSDTLRTSASTGRVESGTMYLPAS